MKKLLIFLFLFSLCMEVSAQKKLFIRVYNNKGKQFLKGHLISTTDSSLLLKSKGDTFFLHLNDFNSIKTKRSAAHNVRIGMLSVSGIFALYGMATSDPDAFLGDTPGSGAAIGAIVGLPVGAAVGGITALFKKSKYFVINGNPSQWKRFQSAIPERFNQ